MQETEQFEKLVDDLLSVLDEDIRLVETSLSHLDGLRGLVIKRDESSLRALIATIERDRKFYVANELKRQEIRQVLAAMLGCSPEEMTLSKLEERTVCDTGQSGALLALPANRQIAVSERKTKLKALVDKLRREHSSTTMLLSECARFNKLLLLGIFGSSDEHIGVTYTAAGNTRWPTVSGEQGPPRRVSARI